MVGVVRRFSTGARAIGVVLLTAIVGAVASGLAVLAGQPVLGVGVALAAIMTGATEFFTLNVGTGPTIPIKTVIVMVLMAVGTGLEALFQAGTTVEYTTIIAGAIAGVVYLQQEIAAWLNQPAPAPSP